MDIYELLHEDHEAISDLFQRIAETSARARKGRKDLFATLRDALMTHARVEQEVFYSLLLDRVEDREAMLEAFEEHGVVELLIDDIDACPLDNERWLAKVTVLKELVEHHVEEEEGAMFELGRKHFSEDEAREIAAAMVAWKAELGA